MDNIRIFAASIVTGGFAGAKAYGASLAGSMHKSFWVNTASSMAGGASGLVTIGVLDEMGAPRWVQTIGALTSSYVGGSTVGRSMNRPNARTSVVDNWRGIDNSDIRALNRINPNNMTGADWNMSGRVSDMRQRTRAANNVTHNAPPNASNLTPSDTLINVDGTLMAPELLADKVRSGEVILINPDKPRNFTRQSNFGEILTDQQMSDLGLERVSLDSVTDIDQVIQQGIDGVFFNPNGHPPYIITESKFRTNVPISMSDSSTGLSTLADGTRQMSEAWIEGIDANRLAKAVGVDVADEIIMNGYASWLVNIDPIGTVTIWQLDSLGRKLPFVEFSSISSILNQ